MPELLEPQDIMFTPFEPKLKNRFIMNVDGIPAYLIKTAGRPQIDFNEVELDHLNTSKIDEIMKLISAQEKLENLDIIDIAEKYNTENYILSLIYLEKKKLHFFYNFCRIKKS